MAKLTKEYLIEHAPHIAERIMSTIERTSYLGHFDTETFVYIVDSWIKHYNKVRERLAENLLKVFELTNGRTGYNVFAESWSDFSRQVKNRFDINDCYKRLDESFNAVIAHLFQQWKPHKVGSETLSSGVGGCMLVARYYISFHDSEYKGVKHIAAVSLNLAIELPCSYREEIDIYE